MSDIKYAYNNTATIAAAGTQTEVLAAKSACNVSVVITNTGAAAITSITATKSPNGASFGPDTALTTALGSLAAGASVLYETSDIGWQTLKLVLASTVGTTYTIEACGKGN